jgi:hypothetical protein
MTDPQILFDRLRYLDKLTSAGIPEAQARAHADAMDAALRESVATKSDITVVRADITAVRSELAIAVRDLKIWVGSAAVLLFGLLGAIKYFG